MAGGRRLVVGDIHGCMKQLEAVLSKSSFDPGRDTLHALGDFCDRGHENLAVIGFLMSLDGLVAVAGNHDMFLMDYLYGGEESRHWVERCGGDVTYRQFRALDGTRKADVADWLCSWPSAIVADTYIMVHGGIPSGWSIDDLLSCQNAARPHDSTLDRGGDLAWDRLYFASALAFSRGSANPPLAPFDTDKTIFVGHTPTDDGLPFFCPHYHLVALDTGCGDGGSVTLMDMDSLEYWQA